MKVCSFWLLGSICIKIIKKGEEVLRPELFQIIRTYDYIHSYLKECTFTTFVFVILNCVDGYFEEVKLKRNCPEPRADKYKLI